MAERRALSFSSLDEVMPDVDRLLEGHTTTGRWSLGQICNHLGTALRYTVEGFPEQAPWLLRHTVGPVAKRQVLGSGAFPEGVKLPEKYLPRPGLDPRAEAEALRASLRLLPGARRPAGGPPPLRLDVPRRMGPLPRHPLRPPPQLRPAARPLVTR